MRANGTFKEIVAAPARVSIDAVLPDLSARLPELIGCRVDAASTIGSLNVGVIAVGSVGRNIAIHLARLGVATIWIVDRGRFKRESLLTQSIAPEDIPQRKASNAARLCKRISPRTRVFAYDGPVEAIDAVALADADVALLSTDNLAAEVEVGQRCLNLGVPLIHAAVHGDTLVAQVRVFGNFTGDGPCPVCAFGETEWLHLNAQTSYSCEGGSPAGAEIRVEGPPTRSIASLCSLAADVAVIQILRRALGLGEPVDDTLVEYCGFTHKTVVSRLARNPGCPCNHGRWRAVSLRRPLAQSTLRELAVAAGARAPERAAFTAGDSRFVETGACRRGHAQPVRRFVAPEQDLGSCPECAAPLSAGAFTSHASVAASRLGALLDRPLRDLADPPPPWILVHDGDASVLLRARATGAPSPHAPKSGAPSSDESEGDRRD